MPGRWWRACPCRASAPGSRSSALTILSTSWNAATDVAAARGEDAQEAAEQQALPESGAGYVVEHQAIRRRRSSSPPLASRAGSRFTNSTSAARYWPSDRIDTHSSGRGGRRRPDRTRPPGRPPRGTRSRRRRRRGPRRAARWWARATREIASPSACTYGSSRATIAGWRWKTLTTAHVGQLLHRRADRLVVLAGQVADVHVDHAQVGHLVHGVAADDPAEIDRRPVEQVGGLARERQRSRSGGRRRSPSARRCHRATASSRARRCPHLHAHGEHALRLDADVEVGGLAGDREVAEVAARRGSPSRGRRAPRTPRRTRTRSGRARGPARRRSRKAQHHRREAALHVVGAAAVQPVAVHARLELLRAAGHHVEVSVQHDRRPALRARPWRPARGGRCACARSPRHPGPRASP